jgi:molybdopterin molybdotransferase
MLSEEEALARILAFCAPLPAVEVPLLEALGARLSRGVWALVPLPGFDNSSMDGYAVRAGDVELGKPLQVVAEQAAGRDEGHHLGAGEAIRIFTGAPVPAGADAVIMQEDVELGPLDSSRASSCDVILPKDTVVVGENVRRVGSDLCTGQCLAKAGEMVRPGLVGLLASQGLTTVAVHGWPRVAVLSTGDELVAPGTSLLPGQLYNSNGPMLAALLVALGIPVNRVEMRHCEDSLDATVTAMRELTSKSDVVLVSGGVSVGDRDYVKPALAALGMPPELWRVRVKPGKPFLFAKRDASADAPGCRVFGLPGNPVSAFVTYQLFVRPALLRLLGAGLEDCLLPTAEVRVASDLRNSGDRPHYLRGRVIAGEFRVVGAQQSHALFGLSQSDALLRLGEEEEVAAGALRKVLSV